MDTSPGGHIFWQIKFSLAVFQESHLLIIAAKLFLFWQMVRSEDILSFL